MINIYIARAKEWPEVTAIENSRNAAIPVRVASLTARLKLQAEIAADRQDARSGQRFSH